MDLWASMTYIWKDQLGLTWSRLSDLAFYPTGLESQCVALRRSGFPLFFENKKEVLVKFLVSLYTLRSSCVFVFGRVEVGTLPIREGLFLDLILFAPFS